MIAAQLMLLLMLSSAIAIEELTLNRTEAIPEAKNAFKFEGQSDANQYGLIRFEDQNRYNNYDTEPQSLENNGQSIKFEDENRIEQQRPNHQKKKRRRKPKKINGAANYQNGVPSFGRPGPVYPGRPFYPGQGYPPYPGPIYKPRPSPTSAALTAVTEALTSIALYDDRQCVPRLLCEAAGGAGAGSSTASGLLSSISGLQPLLTLLAAYNGISSSPLFVFGRAVFLGMTSKANPGTCRYAYPDCPNDPEQLVHYLNNHNGGFFRFFAAPEINHQQGVEQFYNQLSGNYGYYQPQPGQVGYGQLQSQQNPQQGAYQQQGPYQNLNQQSAQDLQQQNYYQYPQQNGYHNYPLQQNLYHNLPQGYGPNQNSQNYGYHKPSLYGNSYGFYGKDYPYQQNGNVNRFQSKEIQKRIQNSPSVGYVDNNVGNSKWLFPGQKATDINYVNVNSNIRLGKVLKFPGTNINPVKATEGFIFPGIQSNRDYLISDIEAEADDFKDGDNRELYFNKENQYSYGVYSENSNKYNNVRTVYIVRGNSDPNHPEVVHLAPGQTLQ